MNNIIQKLEGKNIAILGFGKEGYSTYKYIRKHLPIQKLTILDKNVYLTDNYNELKSDSNIEFVLGDNYLENLVGYDYIIKTPGIYLDNDNYLKLAGKITSQMDLVLEETDAYIIGITGTKGKSTTSSLLYKVLKDQDIDTYLVGNIGNPILDYIDFINKDSILVTEFSAHQLQYLKKSPKIGIILNLFEEHLDYFKTLENYYLAKLNMFKYQNEDDYALYYNDNSTLNYYVTNMNIKSNKIKVSTNTLGIDGVFKDDSFVYEKINGEINKLYNIFDERKLLGSHNVINIMFILKVAKILNLNIEKARESINNFTPLKHRLQKVGIYKDIIFYNDTIATIPTSTLNGIKALKIVDTLIFGGMNRGIDYSNFASDLVSAGVRNFICMPDTGNKIGKEIELIDSNVFVYYTNDLFEAVKIAYQVTAKNKICLLSPAAPSYNKYKNFEEKGDKYIEFIKELAN